MNFSQQPVETDIETLFTYVSRFHDRMPQSLNHIPRVPSVFTFSCVGDWDCVPLTTLCSARHGCRRPASSGARIRHVRESLFSNRLGEATWKKGHSVAGVPCILCQTLSIPVRHQHCLPSFSARYFLTAVGMQLGRPFLSLSFVRD